MFFMFSVIQVELSAFEDVSKGLQNQKEVAMPSTEILKTKDTIILIM